MNRGGRSCFGRPKSFSQSLVLFRPAKRHQERNYISADAFLYTGRARAGRGRRCVSVELRVTGLQYRKGFHYEEILQLGLRFDADSGRADGSAERGDLC